MHASMKFLPSLVSVASHMSKSRAERVKVFWYEEKVR